MAIVAPHIDMVGISQRIGGTLNKLKSVGLLSDANVVAANTQALFLSILDTNFASKLIHNDIKDGIKDQAYDAVNKGYSLGLFTTGSVAALTTVAGLVALTDASTTFQKTMRD